MAWQPRVQQSSATGSCLWSTCRSRQGAIQADKRRAKQEAGSWSAGPEAGSLAGCWQGRAEWGSVALGSWDSVAIDFGRHGEHAFSWGEGNEVIAGEMGVEGSRMTGKVWRHPVDRKRIRGLGKQRCGWIKGQRGGHFYKLMLLSTSSFVR